MIRLNQSNLFFDTRKIYKLAGLNVSEDYFSNVFMLDKIIDLNSLSNISGQSINSLISMGFFNEIGGYNDIDSRIIARLKKKVTCVNKSQVCSQCLIEEPYHRKIWEISLVTSCHKHKCLLVHKCQQCNKKISPYRSDIVYCKCGFDFRCSDIFPVEDVRLSQLLNSKLVGKSNNNLKGGSILHEYTFAECLYLLLVFSERVARIYFSKITLYTSNPNGYELHDILCKTLNIFYDWPNNLKRHLVDMVAFEGEANNSKITLHLFTTGMKKQLPLDHFRLIFEALLVVLSQLSNENKRFNRNKESILDFINNGIDKQKREKIIENSIDFNEAAYLLGVDKNKLKLLTKHNVISSCKIDGFRTMLDRQYISSLLSELIKITDEYEPSNEIVDTINFSSLIKLAKTYSFQYPEIVTFIISGELKVMGLDESSKGFAKLLFSKSQVEEVLSIKRLPPYVIAKKLKVSKRSVLSWMHNDFLPYTKVKNYYYVVPQDFEKFRNKYISIVTILNIYKHTKSSKKMLELLAKKNIVPVSGGKIDGGNCYLFEYTIKLKKLLGFDIY